ncbi:MAG: ribosome silencing factor [Deltaproteobacteria bacterium]
MNDLPLEEETDLIWGRILIAANAAMEKKATAPVVLDLRKHTAMADYFLIVTGRSDTQVRAIADGIGESLRHAGVYPLAVEGERHGQWVLLDYGDFVVHSFYGPTRELYALETLWARATVRELPPEIHDAPEPAEDAPIWPET